MELRLTYKSQSGTVNISGGAKGNFRLTDIEGLGNFEREYQVSTFSGYDGQETLSSRALPRAITLGIEAIGNGEVLRDALRVFEKPGYLYIENGDFSRKIYCNQARIPQPERVLRGQISTFVVQFVCDMPFFEDGAEIVVPLYGREKRLKTHFSLPCAFGVTNAKVEIANKGNRKIEPVIKIKCPITLENEERILIKNITSGAKIELSYTPREGEEIIIDIKTREVCGSVSGDLRNSLSDDTFLGDFVFGEGVNIVETLVGDSGTGFAVECRFTNLYSEAVIV